MSQIQQILRAAVTLATNMGNVFAAADLVVAAWESDRRAFGLAGHEEAHPDSNRVLSYLMGCKGLVARGWLEKVEKCRYAVTVAGLALSKLPDGPVPRPKKIKLPEPARGRTDTLRTYRETLAYDLWKMDKSSQISFSDAVAFWGGSALFVDTAGSIIQAARRTGEPDSGPLLLLQSFLEQRFASHIRLLENRRKA